MTDSPDARYWSGRRVLVTGAAGFIGSHVVEQLVRHGANVRAFVRYNSRNDYGWLDRLDSDTVLDDVDVFRGDLTNPEAVSSAFAAQDAVLHLGALIPIPYSYQHPREYVAANVEGAINVLEAARRSDIERLVHVSSSEVYGTAQTVPIDESHPLVPQSPYAATKVAADQLVLSFVRSFETPAVIARPFNTFGPRQTARAVIPTIIMQALQSGTVELGSTTPTRDFLYAADTAAGIMRCCATDGIVGETINLGTGVEWSVAEVVDLVGKIVGLELSVGTDESRIRPAGSEVDRLLADNRKAMELLDWQPTVPFVEGLERTVEWSRRWLKDYKPSVYNV